MFLLRFRLFFLDFIVSLFFFFVFILGGGYVNIKMLKKNK